MAEHGYTTLLGFASVGTLQLRELHSGGGGYENSDISKFAGLEPMPLSQRLIFIGRERKPGHIAQGRQGDGRRPATRARVLGI